MYRPLILAWNSGAGKDSLAAGLAQKDGAFLVSRARITTRNPRKNESSMTFIDATTFSSREKTGQIIGAYEWIEGHKYGIDVDILRVELENHHPILPFWGDTLEIQQKYLMDLAWFCRENWYPIPLYFLLQRHNIEKQELDIRARELPSKETQKRVGRIYNRNAQIVTWPIMRHYKWLIQANNLEDKQDMTMEHLLWLFRHLNKNLGGRFFRERHERP